jgi:hypothetical protein
MRPAIHRISMTLVSLALSACGMGAADVSSANGITDPTVLEANAEDMSATDVTEQEITSPFGITGTHSASQLTMTVILRSGLSNPSSLAFKPSEDSLWIVNQGNDSSVIVDRPGKSDQKVTQYWDDSDHFMNNPTQISFSRYKEEFAVSLNNLNDYNGGARPNYFTGVTLYTSNRYYYRGDANSHLDMLHHSPNAMGLIGGMRPTSSSSDKREYWVFNGLSGSIDRYFFNAPHELGGDDHSDGITVRYGTGSIKRVSTVPGHLAFNTSNRTLYIADTGNGRIAKLNTKLSLDRAVQIQGYHDETPLYELVGNSVESLTSYGSLSRPSGLLYKGSRLVVAENGTGHIKVFDTYGTLKGDIDTGLGSGALTGLAEGPDGKLYFLDSRGGRVLRLDNVN